MAKMKLRPLCPTRRRQLERRKLMLIWQGEQLEWLNSQTETPLGYIVCECGHIADDHAKEKYHKHKDVCVCQMTRGQVIAWKLEQELPF